MRDSCWRPVLRRTGLDTDLAGWLREPQSLTARLLRRGKFRVELIGQQRQQANPDERTLLGLRTFAPCWVREVTLYCDGQALIFAHTVLPAYPRGVLSHWFAGLGSRSLGSLLFMHPGFRREDLSFARIDARHPLYASAVTATGLAPEYFYARRCLHHYRRQAVLVTEVFSPAFAGQAD